MKDGNILQGNFKDGKREGIFLYHDKAKNKIIRRIYENDNLKEQINDN